LRKYKSKAEKIEEMKGILVSGSVVWFSPVQPCGEGKYQVEIREFRELR
jgi:hypothetical protein